MPVKIRLARGGAKKNPCYRVVVADSEAKRDGKFLERVGYYEPTRNPKVLNLDLIKINEWISKGAKPTETVKALITQSKQASASNS